MKIAEALKHTRNPFELAELTELPLRKVREALREETEPLSGWGRLQLQQHIVSRRHWSDEHWPGDDLTRLAEMRRLHDQGRVTMCQGRDGNWIIQYAIPVQGRPIRRSPYFYGV